MHRFISARCRAALTRALVGGSLLALGASPALAVQSAADVCDDVARKANRAIWDSVRKTGDELFCRKPWVSRPGHEYLACHIHVGSNKFASQLKNHWNRFFDRAGGEWATWGTRGLGPTFEEGTIRGGFRRVFFGAGLAYSRSTIEVVKEGGRAEANITVCELDRENRVRASHRRTFPNGRGGEGTARTITLDHEDSRILGVVVDTPASINNFEYRTRIESEPIRVSEAEAAGIADLHVHQMVNLAFGGRMYWGQHDGPKELALRKEEINGRYDPNARLESLLTRILEGGLDANVLLRGINGGTTDEGFYSLGGGGHPDYEDWPHHADRSHQQVHIDWLREAHERGRRGLRDSSNLNLVVVSLVNNNVLCQILKAADPRGNVPRQTSDGDIKGWESAGWGCSDDENVLRQIEAAHALERTYPWYRIAMSPWHARKIIEDGDLAVVLSIETDKPLSDDDGTYGSWEDQLDRYRALGVTTMQVVHESNSLFCGAAPHRGIMEWLQRVQWPIKSLSNLVRGSWGFNTDANGHNVKPFPREGEQLVDALVARNMPIDLAHGSTICRNAIMNRVPDGYGLYDSHTKFERLLRPSRGQRGFGTDVLDREKEFLITEELLPAYVRNKVLIGLRTASVDVYDAPDAQVANTCPGSARSLAQLIQYATDSGLEIAYGTDFNTGVSQLGPRYGNERCFAWRVSQLDGNKKKGKHQSRPASEEEPMDRRTRSRIRAVEPIAGTNYYVDGLATIGWLPELTDDLIRLGTPGARGLQRSAEAYLRMWERAYTATEGDTPTPPRVRDVDPGSIALGGTCTRDDQCGSGRCSSVAGARGTCVCNEDGDCPNGYCNMGADFKKNACVALKADNEACPAWNGDRTCRSGDCREGRCMTAGSVPIGGTCYVGAACAEGGCSSVVPGTRGTCVCRGDGDCDNGYWCNVGLDLKKNACQRKLNKGEQCGVYGDLGHGRRCKSGTCTTKTRLGIPGVTKLHCQ